MDTLEDGQILTDQFGEKWTVEKIEHKKVTFRHSQTELYEINIKNGGRTFPLYVSDLTNKTFMEALNKRAALVKKALEREAKLNPTKGGGRRRYRSTKKRPSKKRRYSRKSN
jgi:hypothetical protein